MVQKISNYPHTIILFYVIILKLYITVNYEVNIKNYFYFWLSKLV